MPDLITQARAALAAITPELPPAALIIFVFLAIFSVRRWAPGAWLVLERLVPFVDTIDPTPGLKILLKFWQALPAALLAAVTSALTGGTSLRIAVWGVVTATLTALSHEVLASYSKFNGQVGGPNGTPSTARKVPTIPPAPKPPSDNFPKAAIRALALGLCFSIAVGCAALASKLSWPAVAKCGPSKDTLVAEVEAILLNGSDDHYQSEIEQLAVKEGAETVECAVQTVIEQLTAQTARLTAKSSAALARAKAFLAKTGTKMERAQ